MSSQSGFTEADWEDIALAQLQEQGWSPLNGADCAWNRGTRLLG